MGYFVLDDNTLAVIAPLILGLSAVVYSYFALEQVVAGSIPVSG